MSKINEMIGIYMAASRPSLPTSESVLLPLPPGPGIPVSPLPSPKDLLPSPCRCALPRSRRPKAEPYSGDMVGHTTRSQVYPSEDRLNWPIHSASSGLRNRRGEWVGLLRPRFGELMASQMFPLGKGTGGRVPRRLPSQARGLTPAPGRISCLRSSHAGPHPGLSPLRPTHRRRGDRSRT